MEFGRCKKDNYHLILGHDDATAKDGLWKAGLAEKNELVIEETSQIGGEFSRSIK